MSSVSSLTDRLKTKEDEQANKELFDVFNNFEEFMAMFMDKHEANPDDFPLSIVSFPFVDKPKMFDPSKIAFLLADDDRMFLVYSDAYSEAISHVFGLDGQFSDGVVEEDV